MTDTVQTEIKSLQKRVIRLEKLQPDPKTADRLIKRIKSALYYTRQYM